MNDGLIANHHGYVQSHLSLILHVDVLVVLAEQRYIDIEPLQGRRENQPLLESSSLLSVSTSQELCPIGSSLECATRVSSSSDLRYWCHDQIREAA